MAFKPQTIYIKVKYVSGEKNKNKMHFNEGLNYIPFNASLHTKKETNLSKKNQSNSDPSAVTPTKTQSTHPSQISIIIFPNESKNNIFNTKKKESSF